MGRCITVAIAGLGSRGRDTYAKAAKIFPEKMKIVAIADVDPEKVRLTAEEYDIPEEKCFSSAEEMLKQEKLQFLQSLQVVTLHLLVNLTQSMQWAQEKKLPKR